MYIVKHFFTDLQDKGHAYNPGDIYPREGLEPSPERYAELASEKNLQEKPLIVMVKDEPKKATAKKPAARKTASKAAKK